MIQRVKGTQDILDLTLYNFLIDQLTTHLEKHNFTQIETPIIEHTKLFQHNLGEESDVVTKEMYTFETEGGDSICLRPESTASTVRAFVENKIEKKPWKVFSYGPMFRHERPQKGRWRQFTQVSAEIIGASDLGHDALFLKMLDYFFDEVLGLENYVLKTNYLGTSQDRALHRKNLLTFLSKHGDDICEKCLVRGDKNPLRVFDCKNEACQELYKNAPLITENLSAESQKEWEELNTQLDMLSVSRVHDAHLVRGLDYYCKVVFEFSSPELGAQNAFVGGGRYRLGTNMGAKENIDSIGVSIGTGRLLMLLDNIKDRLALPQQPRLHMVLPLSEEQKSLALMLVHDLHQKGLCADIVLPAGNPSKMMKRANKAGASFTLLLGEQEMKNGTVMVKNMVSGKQETVKQVEVSEWLKR